MKKYQIIYADPPWKYSLWSDTATGRSLSEGHYDTMDLIDIATVPVKDIADKDCALFMWVTFPTFPMALKLIKAWGFQYKTAAFVWVKKNKKADSWFWGMGSWTRANAEVCVIATKGYPKRISKSVHSVLDDKFTRHSQKPDSARKRILDLMGDLPRIELFAREKAEGWDVWGNEVESDISLTPLTK